MDVFLQSDPRNRVDIEVNILGIADAFPKKSEVTAPFQAIKFLIHTRSKVSQEKQMKLLYRLDIAQFGIHK